jgi:hypothetical protein
MQTSFIKRMRLSPPPRVQVNLNAITHDGLIRVKGSRASEPVTVGQLVEIFEPAGEVEGTAKVARINEKTDLIYLDVRWNTLRDLPGPLQIASTSALGLSSANRVVAVGGWLIPQLNVS